MTMLNNSQLFFGKTAMSDRKKSAKVECYSGSRAEEYPLRFYHEGRQIEVSRIIKQWQTPNSRWFKILGDNGFNYTLVYEQPADKWQIITGNKQ